ncbi:MAG: HEAT repeat domain-containing protein [Myxococcales bacterium]|nr:HEAT repeat domain-containing protein [Myxococcales bacterium]
MVAGLRARVRELLEAHRREEDRRTQLADSEFCNFAGVRHRDELEESWSASSELAQLGPAAVDCLLELLEEPAANLREAASSALCELRLAPEPLWRRLLADPRSEVAGPAVVALANANPPWALEALTSAFANASESEYLRALIVKAAAKVDLAGSRKLLLEAARDPVRSVRVATVDALAELGDDAATAALESMVERPVGGLLGSAAYALERLALRRRREEQAAGVAAGDLEHLDAVALTGDPRAIPPLLQRLEGSRGAEGGAGLRHMWTSGRWQDVERACEGRAELLLAASLAARGRVHVQSALQKVATLLAGPEPERALLPLEVAARRPEPESLRALDQLLLRHAHLRVLIPVLRARSASTTRWYATRFRSALERLEAPGWRGATSLRVPDEVRATFLEVLREHEKHGGALPADLELGTLHHAHDPHAPGVSSTLQLLPGRDERGWFLDYFSESEDCSAHARIREDGSHERLESFEGQWGLPVLANPTDTAREHERIRAHNARVRAILRSKGFG